MKSFPQSSRITISAKDANRLSPHLVSARRLNEVLVMDSIDSDDLRRMVLLEAERATPRVTIVRKLLGRIYARQRAEILGLIFPSGQQTPRA